MSRRHRRGRKVDGILILDKPPGISSNEALQIVKRLYDAQKAGHTGSLDPLATGMLPICFGGATRFSEYLLAADKCYRVTAKLGVQTTTGDSEGDVVKQRDIGEISSKRLEEVLQQFRGEIEQVPSMYSALKHQGQPLYKLARQGITVERKPRTVKIYSLELLGIENDLLEMQICCSKGTYIRTLVEDIGEMLSCGAHVIALRRLTAGGYLEEQMVALQELKKLSQEKGENAIDSLLLPVESAVADWPEARLSEAAAFYLQQGQSVIVPYSPTEGCVRLKMKDGRFLGVGEILKDGKVAPRKLLVQTTKEKQNG